MPRLTFLGDIFPGDELFTIGFGIKSKTCEESVGRWVRNITDVTGSSDYVIGNLESPLVDDDDSQDDTFYGRPLFADVLRDSGVNILNIANNHIMEHGVTGVQQTLSTLHCRNLRTIGNMDHGQPGILDIRQDGVRICMAAFCDERVCNIDNPGCYASLEESKVLETLERMKAMKPGIIIFIFHWGNEYIHIPSLEQRLLSYKLIDQGASLIVGHHPHVIQPYEKYKHGHIIYSLGNFCFDDVQSAHFGKGMIAHVQIEKDHISDLSFSGIQVQDMAYTDVLVKAMPEKDFERYFTQINRHYEELTGLPYNKYQANYEATHRCIHRKERIQMRLDLAKKVLDLRHQHKKQLLSNIKNYLL